MHPGSLDGTGRGQEMPGSQHLGPLPSQWTWILVWFLTALFASCFAKQLKQRQINKLADAGGGNIFSVWVFFPISKLCPIRVFGFRRSRSFQLGFECHWNGTSQSGFIWGAGNWSVEKPPCCWCWDMKPYSISKPLCASYFCVADVKASLI